MVVNMSRACLALSISFLFQFLFLIIFKGIDQAGLYGVNIENREDVRAFTGCAVSVREFVYDVYTSGPYKLYTVSQDVMLCLLVTLTIFGRNVSEKESNQRMLYFSTSPNYYSSPRSRQRQRRLLYFGRVLSFFPTTDFSTSLGLFSRNFATDAVCSEIFYLLYGCSYVPPKNSRGEKPQFLPIC